MTWDEYFIELAKLSAKKSKDTSTKCGCVIVGPNNEVRAIGFNGLPRGCIDYFAYRDERPAKYSYYEHAERNAIYNAARIGTSLDNCKIYVTGFPCCDCARAIIQVGIKEVIIPEIDIQPGFKDRWAESIRVSKELFQETNITIREI